MKAIVESTPTLKGLNKSEINILNNSFISALDLITISKDDKELRENFSYFSSGVIRGENILFWGFGSSHMWVKQINNPERLIIVEF